MTPEQTIKALRTELAVAQKKVADLERQLARALDCGCIRLDEEGSRQLAHAMHSPARVIPRLRAAMRNEPWPGKGYRTCTICKSRGVVDGQNICTVEGCREKLEDACTTCNGEGRFKAMMECDRCDGVGWYEGGETLKTHCEKCGGKGAVPEVT